jgi:hypothetical protein
VPDIVNQVADIDAWRATQKAEADLAKANNAATVVYKEYPEQGLAWKQIKTPEMDENWQVPDRYSIVKPTPSAETFAIKDNETGKYISSGLESEEAAAKHLHKTLNKETLQDALKYEGDIMKHCVGGYCPSVASGQTKIYSLRDAKGKPHVTIEVESQKNASVNDFKAAGIDYKSVMDEAKRRMGLTPETEAQLTRNWDGVQREKSQNELYKHVDDIYNEQVGELPQKILQIKGVENKKPEAEYMPQIQDFVKSGNWSEVKDLKNAGLIRADAIRGAGWDNIGIGQKYLTEQEYDDLLLKNLQPPAQGMAHGGPVSLNELAARYDKGGAVKAGIKKIISLFDDGEEALAKLDAGEKLSKAENIAAGLYHPIGEGKKLNVPFSRMTSTVVDNPNVIMHKGKIITPEQAVKERMGFFPLIGDRADTGKILTHVNERKAKYETPLTGGGKYMQANYDPVMKKSAGWESGKGKVGTLRNRIGDIVESGYQPVGVFSPGSHVQVDFNTMMPHALLGQFDPTDTTKKLIKQFDKEVKAAYPNWVGITHPQAEAQLMDKGNGVLRTQFTKTMGKDSYQSSGFPDVPSVRKAISDPELYNTELGTLGQNMALFDRTGALVEAPKNPSAYPLSMSAQNLGKLDQTENFADFFTTANERRRLMGSDPAGDYRSFELSQPIQYANEEWLNKLLESRRLRDEAIKKGGYAEGGSVNSPATYDPSLIDEIVSSIDEPTGYAEGGSVRMAQGGSVSAYDADLVDAIANQFM